MLHKKGKVKLLETNKDGFLYEVSEEIFKRYTKARW